MTINTKWKMRVCVNLFDSCFLTHHKSNAINNRNLILIICLPLRDTFVLSILLKKEEEVNYLLTSCFSTFRDQQQRNRLWAKLWTDTDCPTSLLELLEVDVPCVQRKKHSFCSPVHATIATVELLAEKICN